MIEQFSLLIRLEAFVTLSRHGRIIYTSQLVFTQPGNPGTRETMQGEDSLHETRAYFA